MSLTSLSNHQFDRAQVSQARKIWQRPRRAPIGSRYTCKQIWQHSYASQTDMNLCVLGTVTDFWYDVAWHDGYKEEMIGTYIADLFILSGQVTRTFGVRVILHFTLLLDTPKRLPLLYFIPSSSAFLPLGVNICLHCTITSHSFCSIYCAIQVGPRTVTTCKLDTFLAWTRSSEIRIF